MKKIKEIKRMYGLTEAHLAQIFGFKHERSFSTSSARPRYEKAVELLHYIFTNEIPKDKPSK
ncbi:hypothetical protein EDM00_07820 [Ornithobacterium rhinotracheale]|uniref:hypothetical protein n=1 Tax=Ornithobacterium rhinotracheale TaxID=28251 RepID=UPI00129C83CB|nr:hypothetical protein [Ornithobacterium rhinotracheale]MRI63894.1 hypothetical protein [Ornithobacterium rhinotracheale]